MVSLRAGLICEVTGLCPHRHIISLLVAIKLLIALTFWRTLVFKLILNKGTASFWVYSTGIYMFMFLFSQFLLHKLWSVLSKQLTAISTFCHFPKQIVQIKKLHTFAKHYITQKLTDPKLTYTVVYVNLYFQYSWSYNQHITNREFQ